MSKDVFNETPEVVGYKRTTNLFEKNPKLKKILFFVLAGVIICVAFLGGMFTQCAIDKGVYSEYDMLLKVVDYVKKYYYVDIEQEEIIKYACMGAVNYLDPYSTYYEEVDTGDDDSAYYGINVSYDVCGLFRVRWVEPNTPSEREGVEIGDYIYKVNDTVVQGDFVSVFENVISNKKVGDEVRLELKKTPDSIVYKTVTLVAEKFPTSYVWSVNDFSGLPGDTVVPDDVGYVKLLKFQSGAEEQFVTAINGFKSAGKKKLVLDLRGNTGGSLNVLEKIASYLLKSDTGSGKIPLAEFTFRGGIKRTSYTVDEYNYLYKDTTAHKIVVLVDKNTASASELLIGAMLTQDGCEIVGTTTYGKGIAQTIQAFPEDKPLFNIKITTSSYSFLGDISSYVKGATTPTYSINGVGFTPIGDNYVEHVAGKNTLLEDVQFKRAIELLANY